MVPVPAGPRLHVMSMGLLTQDDRSPVIWRGPIRANVLRQLIADVEWGELDFLVADLPPGTGDEPLTVAQAFPNADGAIVVSTPQEASLSDCRKAINFVRAVELPVLGVIENMSGFVCPHCSEATDVFGSGGAERMAEKMQVPFLGAIPLVPDVVTRADRGQSLVHEAAPEASRKAFEAVVAAVMAQLGVAHAAAASGE
jgi:Mrp family chromosome partitioning ATPase